MAASVRDSLSAITKHRASQKAQLEQASAAAQDQIRKASTKCVSLASESQVHVAAQSKQLGLGIAEAAATMQGAYARASASLDAAGVIHGKFQGLGLATQELRGLMDAFERDLRGIAKQLEATEANLREEET